eukprot:178787_1
MTQFCGNDHNFKYIYNYLNCNCYANKCKIINSRNSVQLCKHQNIDPTIDAIMRKIHCYFLHSYDANRLTMEEKANILQNRSTQLRPMMNGHIKALRHIANNKPKINNANRYPKYNQLSTNVQVRKDSKLYSFGTLFRYSYDRNKMSYEELCELRQYLKPYDSWDQELFVSVEPKYQFFKEELISNLICNINPLQFNLEYQKAKVHLASQFCKSRYRHIKLNYLLALMIYCNYDKLQYRFSRTYREDAAIHCEFYHLGKFLQIVVNVFGQRFSKLPFDKLYHGLSKKIVFPCYGIGNEHLCIHGPLSTSSCIMSAINFTSYNGLVVTFESVYKVLCHIKCFDVSWLSDYPNEKEHLFIQMHGWGTHMLTITNLVDSQTAQEYKVIIETITDIDVLFSETSYECTVKYPHLMTAIVQQQLPQECKHYKVFKSLTAYGKQMCTRYFNNKEVLHFDYYEIQRKHKRMFEIIFPSDGNIVGIDIIHSLCPNVAIMDFRNLKQSIRLSDSVDLWISLFDAHQLFVYVNQNDVVNIRKIKPHELHIEHVAMLFVDQFAISHKICPTDDELLTNINKLLKVMISDQSEKRNINMCKWTKGSLFNRCCFWHQVINVVEMSWFWNRITSNKQLCLFEIFCHQEYEWVKIEQITKVFTKLKYFCIKNINLTERVMENILQSLEYLRDNTVLEKFAIATLECNEVSVQEAMKYQTRFNASKYRLKRLYSNELVIIRCCLDDGTFLSLH